jgi:hypothetical protein
MKIPSTSFCTCLLLLLAASLLFGCASTKVPRYMSSDYVSGIKNIVVVTKLDHAGLSLLDLSEIKKKEHSKQYGGVTRGALGASLEWIIVEGIASYKINSLIGGSIEPVRESIADFDARTTFDDITYKTFSEQIRTHREIHSIVMLKANDLYQEDRVKNQPHERKNNGSDVVLEIDYSYGIGAFSEERPLPVIVARISVRCVPEHEIIMSDTVVTYSCDDHYYTLADYAANNGEIYKQCFREIAEKLSQRLANIYF